MQGELLILAVGNGRQAGGGMRLCPYAGKHAYSVTRPALYCAVVGTTHLVQQTGHMLIVIACCAVTDVLCIVMCWSKRSMLNENLQDGVYRSKTLRELLPSSSCTATFEFSKA